MDNPQAYLNWLKPIHIFKGLTDEQILDFARELTVEKHSAGTVVVEEGAEGQHFYIIHKGMVKVERLVRDELVELARLEPGDFFGETALLYGRRRTATVTTLSDVTVLRLSKEDFDRLLLRYPVIKPNLLVEAESRELYRTINFGWLNPEEVVYLITRRHPILLWQAQVAPVFVGVVVAALAVGAALTFDLRLALFVAGLGGLPAAGWLVWNYYDWSNDFYIVTNQRVVYLEKIVGIYDSRQEAPLTSIQSVNVQTAGALERVLGIGDVIVRTFSGPIVMRAVANPRALAAMVEEHWTRTKTRMREAEQESLRRAVRQRIGLVKEPPKQPAPPPKAAAPSKAKPAAPSTPIAEQVADFFSFKMRFERGGAIVYRKHWYVLLLDIWQPSLFIMADLGLIGLWLAGFMGNISFGAVLLVALVGFIPFGFWWWYQFEDWKNDTYQVTSDQIVDIEKKPLGKETRQAAPLGNVLSLKYERPGLLGLLLNYGTVSANIAGQQFTFEGVFDPVGVQNDLYRRIEALNAKKAEAEAAKKREEMADWVGVYHRVVTEANEEIKGQNPPNPVNPA